MGWELKKMMKFNAIAATAACVVAFAAGTASAATVTTLDGSQGWTKGDTTGGGTSDIVDLSGAGGNLENNAPLPDGAVKLTTTSDNNDRAEISLLADFGLVSDILTSGFSVSYDMFKALGGALEDAPALKLSFLNLGYAGDGYVTLIFEPYWNQPGFEGTSYATPAGDWSTYSISLDSGLFWQTGGFGQSNSAGGPPLKTLNEWVSTFDSGFSSASMVALTVGLGTYNPSEVGYVDNVKISGTLVDGTSDFDVAPVPVPAALPLFAAGLAGFGWIGWRRNRRSASPAQS
jgi:hypothetical protein